MTRTIGSLLICAGILMHGRPAGAIAAASALNSNPTASRIQLTNECKDFNVQIHNLVSVRKLREAEDALNAVLKTTMASDPTCAAVVMGDLAALMSLSGRPVEAEKYAEDSLNRFSSVGTVGDEILVRPLQVLATSRLRQGRLHEARQAFDVLRSLPIEKPESLALVHGLSAALLEAEGRLEEAEAEYAGALDAWEQAGKKNSVDSAAVLNGLACLYIKEKRLDEALKTVNHELSIVNSAEGALPMDRIAALNVRATAYAKRSEWRNARNDLQIAVSIAEQESRLDRDFFVDLLTAYAYTLRKDHCSREARSVQARASALASHHGAATVIDTSQLLQKR